MYGVQTGEGLKICLLRRYFMDGPFLNVIGEEFGNIMICWKSKTSVVFDSQTSGGKECFNCFSVLSKLVI